MRIPFTKMHGAGNDFVVIDHRKPYLPAERRQLFARLCDRRRGVGADGVLLLELDDTLDFAMRYHNADGGVAEFCGNGARCLARFALSLGLGRAGEVTFRTDAGVKRARATADGRIALWFGPVEDGEAVTLGAVGRTFAGRRVVTGVPHVVIPVPKLDRVPLTEWAPPRRAARARTSTSCRGCPTAASPCARGSAASRPRRWRAAAAPWRRRCGRCWRAPRRRSRCTRRAATIWWWSSSAGRRAVRPRSSAPR